MRHIITAIVLSFFIAFGATAENSRNISPNKAGFSIKRLQRFDEIAKHDTSSGKIPNMITRVNHGGRIVDFNATGQQSMEDVTPVKPDDLSRIDSMTKSITAVAASQLDEQSVFRLTDPVLKYVPALAALKYTNENGELVDAERISGERFDQHLNNHVLDPLEMQDIFFEVPPKQLHFLVKKQVFDREIEKLQTFSMEAFRQRVLGLHHADVAMINFEKVRLYSDGGGLVSAAMDYMRFGEMLRADGSLGKTGILSPKRISS